MGEFQIDAFSSIQVNLLRGIKVVRLFGGASEHRDGLAEFIRDTGSCASNGATPATVRSRGNALRKVVSGWKLAGFL